MSARTFGRSDVLIELAARHALDLRFLRGWTTLCAPVEHEAPDETLGRPGLWKSIGDGRAVLDLPPAAIRVAEREQAQEALFDWATATLADGRPDVDPQGVELAGRWQDGVAMGVSVGTHSSVIRLVNEADRLALCCRIGVLPAAPTELSRGRRAWLEATLRAGNDHWRMVRVGSVAASGEVLAEVDLTGVPRALLTTLLDAALPALRWVAAWALPTVSIILRADLCAELLDMPPIWIRSMTAADRLRTADPLPLTPQRENDR